MRRETLIGGSRRTWATWLVGPLAALLAACNFPGGQPVTPTLSSDQVVQTAEAIAQATLAAITPSSTPVPPTPSPVIPTLTPAPSATPTSGAPMVVANYNANLRRGPGENYEVVDFLLGGQQADVLGRYDNSPIGTWWYVRLSGGNSGWVWSGAVAFSGSAGAVPVLTPAPTSTASPGPTSAPTQTPTVTPTST